MQQEWPNPNNFEFTDPAQQVLHLKLRKAYQYALPYCEKKKILEVGCGAGYGAKELSKVSTEVVGVDKDEKAIIFAKGHYNASNVKYIKGDPIQGLPFKKSEFDLIICFQVIEHVTPQDLKVFLREIKRLLADQGKFLLTTPNRKIRLLPFQQPWNKDHKKEYTGRNLKRTLRQYFPKVEILSLRAKERLEKIDRGRTQQNPYKVYFRNPASRILNKFFPGYTKTLLKNYRDLICNSGRSEINSRNKEAPPDFSLDDLWYERSLTDKALNFMAICSISKKMVNRFSRS